MYFMCPTWLTVFQQVGTVLFVAVKREYEAVTVKYTFCILLLKEMTLSFSLLRVYM